MSTTTDQTTGPSGARLAIIIPAYKAKFLREALQSVASQTDKNFQLYVGDDGSPEPIAEIIREFANQLPVKYHRFDENMGRHSLVKHWERCIRLTSESWIWLFSDDDVMDEGCVAAFFRELENTREGHDLYRFNTLWLNSVTGKSSESPLHPVEESGTDFLRARLGDGRNSTLQELIFSRQAWTKCGGIPDFPLAWASDDAFIAQLGLHRTIRAISGPRVNWRLSDVNITNDVSIAATRIKIMAWMSYFRWVTDYFKKHKEGELAGITRLIEQKLLHLLANCWIYLDREICRELDALGVSVLGHRCGWGWLKGMQLNWRLTLTKISLRLKIPC